MNNGWREESMTRIVKDPAVRRDEILDVAQRLVATKGYEQMTIQDIVDELQIAKGTVYHYFDSKPALLFALIQRMGDQAEQLILPIVHDPTRSALDKLQRFFTTLDQEKRMHRDFVLEFLRIWYTDENAIVRYKLYQARIKRFAPLLSEIIDQGSREGAFQTPYPDQAARIVLSLLEDMGYAIAEILLSQERSPNDLARMQRVALACADALERVLSASTGCLQRNWHEVLEQWQNLSM
jgi:AcrR family transcriptional regulator